MLEFLPDKDSTPVRTSGKAHSIMIRSIRHVRVGLIAAGKKMVFIANDSIATHHCSGAQ